MKKSTFILFILHLSFFVSAQQQFISKAKIEFEVKTNTHKTMGEGIWADLAKDNMPKFTIAYYDYTFSGNKSIYQFNRFDEKNKMPWNNETENENIWYNDLDEGLFTKQRMIAGEKFLIRDSLMNMEWRMTNESREIAGFYCRKAFTKIFDSVYVFAFYTDEITISGGPMGLHGLPGMILGVTIPRMYTSWIATKVQIVGIDDKLITPPAKGKPKSVTEFRKSILDVTKNWEGDWKSQFLWSALL